MNELRRSKLIGRIVLVYALKAYRRSGDIAPLILLRSKLIGRVVHVHALKAYRGSGDIAPLILNRIELRGQLWVPSALPL
jgi:hypothetical protein